MNPSNAYPLKFIPQLVEKVWGGHKLHALLHKESGNKIGESWELSGVSGHISVVAEGLWKGTSLSTLIEKLKGNLVGDRVYETFGNQFPLLFKFIDAADDLSVQVHPDDDIAKRKHNGFGKTEMWYILQASEEARLILGFEGSISKSTYLKCLSEGDLLSILHEEPIKKGDAFYISPGTVHAIGRGTLLAEIQQTSDITYRIYDWDRPDVNGTFRELHTEEALEVAKLETASSARLSYVPKENEPVLLCESTFFYTSILQLTKTLKRDYRLLDSFVVLMCVDGEAEIITENHQLSFKKGETVLIPACLGGLSLKGNQATILEVSVPLKG